MEFVAISMLILWALAPMMFPIKPRTDEAMKNHLLPKMSERRPTSVKPTAKAAVHDMETQMMLGDGPIAALISVRVLAGRTHPKYPDIWARQVACIQSYYHYYSSEMSLWALTTTVPMKPMLR
jgi:hypothetical protein